MFFCETCEYVAASQLRLKAVGALHDKTALQGQIAAFDPNTGNFLGLMNGADGKPIAIDGLWGLKFGNGAAAGAVNVLFFSAGPNDEDDGLFGMLSLTPTPAPK